MGKKYVTQLKLGALDEALLEKLASSLARPKSEILRWSLRYWSLRYPKPRDVQQQIDAIVSDSGADVGPTWEDAL